MKLGAVNLNNSCNANLAFGRKLKEDEKKRCQTDIKDGLNALDKRMTIILPTNCSPVYKTEDIGVGQPYSECASKNLYSFLSSWGFEGQQRQPSGLGKPTDASPYVSNSSAYNTAFINLNNLTKPQNGAILSRETYKEIVAKNPKQGSSKSSYQYATSRTKGALTEAYDTFKGKLEDLDHVSETERKAILKLNNDFEAFKEQHGKEQEKNALYSILTDINGNDYWPNWQSETDRELFSNSGSKEEIKARQNRLKQLKRDNAEEIDSFLFSQMLAKKEIDNGVSLMKKYKIKSKGDTPVAISDAEVWGNKDLFLKDWRMGCAEPWDNGNHQKWGFFVLDPEQLFEKDNSLGKAGQFLHDKYLRTFKENPGGVRIDHIVGLIDPFVYNVNNNGEGRLYSEVYKGANGKNCDKILKDIVLPAANEAGLDASNIIAEDLGYMPGNSKEVLRNLGIGGTRVTQWMKPEQIKSTDKTNTIMVSNHDTASAKELYPDKGVRKNKFVELFTSGAKNIQIFWTDLFGIKERYNQPGAVGDDNWSLRLTEDFEDRYHKRLEDNDAVNLPEVILEANKRQNPNFEMQNKQLANNLKHWANVLKEKE